MASDLRSQLKLNVLDPYRATLEQTHADVVGDQAPFETLRGFYLKMLRDQVENKDHYFPETPDYFERLLHGNLPLESIAGDYATFLEDERRLAGRGHFPLSGFWEQFRLDFTAFHEAMEGVATLFPAPDASVEVFERFRELAARQPLLQALLPFSTTSNGLTVVGRRFHFASLFKRYDLFNAEVAHYPEVRKARGFADRIRNKLTTLDALYGTQTRKPGDELYLPDFQDDGRSFQEVYFGELAHILSTLDYIFVRRPESTTHFSLPADLPFIDTPYPVQVLEFVAEVMRLHMKDRIPEAKHDTITVGWDKERRLFTMEDQTGTLGRILAPDAQRSGVDQLVSRMYDSDSSFAAQFSFRSDDGGRKVGFNLLLPPGSLKERLLASTSQLPLRASPPPVRVHRSFQRPIMLRSLRPGR